MHENGLCLCSVWVYTALSPSFTLIMKYKHTFFTVGQRERKWECFGKVGQAAMECICECVWGGLLGEISLVISLGDRTESEHQAQHVREFGCLGSKYAGMPFITGLPSCWPKRYLIPHFLQPNERKKGGQRKSNGEVCVCVCVCGKL